MWKTLIRPAMIFIPITLGFLFPQGHVLNMEPWCMVRWLLMCMIFFSCLQLHLNELKLRREHFSVLLANLAMGILPFLILKICIPQHPEFALSAFFVGITPTATAAPVVVAFLNGRVGFALTGFAVTNVCVSIALIGLLPLITGQFTPDFIWNVVQTLCLIMALPFLAAQGLRKLFPALEKLPKKCKMLSFSMWSMILFILSATARQYLLDHPETPKWTLLIIAGISLCICILNFRIGGRISSRRLCRESSQILGQKNTTFTMYLALHYANPLVALGPISYILWHNLWNSYQIFQADRRRVRREKRKRQASGR